MISRLSIRCAVCRELRCDSETWFQVTENRWTDRLKVLRFQDTLATLPGIHNVCCAAHLRELVVHWMTTGRLDFPFACVPFSPRRLVVGCNPEPNSSPEPFTPAASILGELAVHRESLTRLLRRNPGALSAVLEALIRAVEPGPGERFVAAARRPRLPLEEPAPF